MKLIVTIPGMGKTTWRKDERCDRRNFVDFDYHLTKGLWTPDVLNANSNVVNTLFKAGVENVCVNVGLINMDAINNSHEVIALMPNDVEIIKQRVEERDGSNWLSEFIDECVERLNELVAKNSNRFTITVVSADSVTDYFTSEDTMKPEDEERLTDPEPEELKDEPESTDDVEDEANANPDDVK